MSSAPSCQKRRGVYVEDTLPGVTELFAIDDTGATVRKLCVPTSLFCEQDVRELECYLDTIAPPRPSLQLVKTGRESDRHGTQHDPERDSRRSAPKAAPEAPSATVISFPTIRQAKCRRRAYRESELRATSQLPPKRGRETRGLRASTSAAAPLGAAPRSRQR